MLNKRTLASLAVFILSSVYGYTQSADVQRINKIITPTAALEPLHFLSSDKLMGRGTKRPEIHVAAKYIADFFKKNDVKSVAGAKDYYQSFELTFVTAPGKGSLKINDSTYEIGKDILQIGGDEVTLNAPVLYVRFGNKEDLDTIDVKGKIVVTDFGVSESSTLQDGFANVKPKQLLLMERGAVAMIERLWQDTDEWGDMKSYFSGERFVQQKYLLPVFIWKSSGISKFPHTQASLHTEGNKSTAVPAKNVIGMVQGTDAKMKEQYILLSAHYDHIGVASQPQQIDGKADSIYNGTRDNAIGVTAVMNAAKYFTKHPPKRSMLFVLFTGEELGLLGSMYFAEHPSVPLNRIVYNLNCDNAGYNDTSMVTVVGLGRTTADEDIRKAASAYGVTAIPDPVPEINLFDRSDNVNFAVHGIPSPTYSMGIRTFDSVIMKNYHQLSDELSTFNLSYGLKYVRSYILTASYIANNPQQPAWIKDDKYEAAWKKLYDVE